MSAKVKVEFKSNKARTKVVVNISCPEHLTIGDISDAFQSVIEVLVKSRSKHVEIGDDDDNTSGMLQ